MSLAVFAGSATAQISKESRTIIISNGDTTVNGKKIAELSKSDREKVQKDFAEMHGKLKESRVKTIEIDGTGIILNGDERGGTRIISRHPDTYIWNNKSDSSKVIRLAPSLRDKKDFKVFRFNGDSLVTAMNVDSLIVKHFDFDHNALMPTMRIPGDAMDLPNALRAVPRTRVYADAISGVGYGAGRNNSQSFNYSNTDKNGITTRMNIRISDAEKENLKKISGNDSPSPLAVDDLTLFPNFSSGKMTLSFNVAGKGTTEVKLLDSDKQEVFSDKPANFSGHYVKQISLPKNGVYYVSISQNGKWFVKKLVKEQ